VERSKGAGTRVGRKDRLTTAEASRIGTGILLDRREGRGAAWLPFDFSLVRDQSHSKRSGERREGKVPNTALAGKHAPSEGKEGRRRGPACGIMGKAMGSGRRVFTWMWAVLVGLTPKKEIPRSPPPTQDLSDKLCVVTPGSP